MGTFRPAVLGYRCSTAPGTLADTSSGSDDAVPERSIVGHSMLDLVVVRTIGIAF